MIFRQQDEPSEPDSGLEKKLKALERKAEASPPGFDAPFYNRAGDLCVEARDRKRALQYYGRGIDAYLHAGRYTAAGAVCRKLLRVSPKSVRARATLACLSIGKGLLIDAEREVNGYVKAAVAAGHKDLARMRLRVMADSTYNDEIRVLLAGHLRELGDPDTADRIMAESAEAVTEREEAEELWSRLLRTALMGADELRHSG